MTGQVINLVSDLKKDNRIVVAYKILLIAFVIGIFLFTINLMGQSFRLLGTETAQSIFNITSNPFVSLFIGLLITAIIQSSSTTTSMVVAAVAAGTLSIDNAVPMIMGANIGTTLTSTLVSLGYITKIKEFRKAISAGTLHDFFNIFVTVILLPLELYYSLLSGLAIWITSFIMPLNNDSEANSFSYNFWQELAVNEWIISTIDNFFIILALSFILLILSIKLLSNLIYDLLIGNIKNKFQNIVFATPLKSFIWGTALTATIQSSSITTPLVVPLVATGKIPLKKAFPYIMGANIGTTITALIAAISHSNAAISIAVTHVLFNLIGVLIFFPFKFLREIPIQVASQLGSLTIKNRLIGFIYILITFFLLPFTLIYLHKDDSGSLAKERRAARVTLFEKN